MMVGTLVLAEGMVGMMGRVGDVKALDTTYVSADVDDCVAVFQHCFLGGSRLQAITGHSNTISGNTDIPEEVKRRVLPGLKSETLTPQP